MKNSKTSKKFLDSIDSPINIGSTSPSVKLDSTGFEVIVLLIIEGLVVELHLPSN